ncbi:hypothetical protein [Nocardia salmonicida]|uniref:hypothetical protein n=1 Tax=Nocardia salmonicida TaxID=53431 RepID=UPI003CF4BC21
MELLVRYVAEAMRRNLIDEWHVWNFSRNPADDQWLREQFPVIGRSPDNLEYFPAGQLTAARGDLALPRSGGARRPHSAGTAGGDGGDPAFEYVIGGWSNQPTVLRDVENRELLVRDDADRRVRWSPIEDVPTPGILSATAFRDIELSIDTTEIVLRVDGAEIIRSSGTRSSDVYDIHVKTGYGADGE